MKVKKIPPLLFFAASLIVLTSCVTSVTFDVEHPPLVDLRNVNTITVIPLEWSSGRRYELLSIGVTRELLSGIRKGGFNTIDPYTLENVVERNYRRYVDIYVKGRITNITPSSSTNVIKEEKRGDEIIRTINVTRAVSVSIEYSYIRAVNREVLGSFKKTESYSTVREYTTSPQYSYSRRRDRGSFRQRDFWVEDFARYAIEKFSGTMDHELGPWITTEKRYIKGQGNNPDAAEAKKLIRQGQYDQALALYAGIYAQTGSVSAGYNVAILLEANEQFTEALALLKQLHTENSPSYITKEIQRITAFIEGMKILEDYRDEEEATDEDESLFGGD